MERILTLTDQELNDSIDTANYRQRRAARAVLFDERGAVALMYARNIGFYKLPGGGIDSGEEILDALHRELLEETGCNAEVVAELGEIFEHRSFERMQQTSYCYLAKIVGEKGTPTLTKSEIRDGFEVHWFDNIDEAIERVEKTSARADQVGLQFMAKRDGVIMRAAKSRLGA
ncbi:NUDIX hydrolase [Candidatus Saccharibacteria bacterium]|nr:MAG: NUDIX hydrolase [Candidatus Saccharibacteria bacterium]